MLHSLERKLRVQVLKGVGFGLGFLCFGLLFDSELEGSGLQIRNAEKFH